MELQPNFSLLLQVILFIYLWVVLKRFLFEPVLDVLDRRTERTVGSLAQARDLKSEAKEARERYDTTVQSTRRELARQAMDARAQAREQQSRVISVAKEEGAAEIERFRVEISEEVAQVRAALEADARSLAEQMIAKVVRREAR